ncbi:hypothetical protein BC793_12023 [Actinoplanes xinjiangensis]|uniref:Uncharacterized protein n=2 Tax=Actinoplanes xinjiangensis TaxID=512350 RepID=A0A316F5G7_9ACTN|nr:hypothetical protein BC793_12023 [Actinoplanes xinjiangensis]
MGGGVRLEFDDDAFHELTIEGSLRFVRADGPERHGEPVSLDVAEQLIQLLNTPVTAAAVDPHGTLAVTFGSVDLVVPYDEMYETWQMRSDQGLLIVSMPGGDLAIWNPEIDGPDRRWPSRRRPTRTDGGRSGRCRLSLMIDVMGAGDPYTTITESTFVARFLLDPRTDTAASVANVDAFVDLPDGATWALTIFTVEEVARLLARWKETGEVANGSYFWAVDQLIVPEPGVAAMTAAIRELVRSGDITSVGVRCDNPD